MKLSRRKLAKRLSPVFYVVAKIIGLRYFLRILYGFFHEVEKLGYHITPNHFYSPIPDVNFLRTRPEIWEKESSLVGINVNLNTQMFYLKEVIGTYCQEVDFSFPVDPHEQQKRFSYHNAPFKEVDAEALYSIVRYHKPRNIIEIGGGGTTILTAQAIRKNREEGFNTQFICIEPYPVEISRGFPYLTRDIDGLSEIREQILQEIDVSFFSVLRENDILFIDSSHTVKIGSDVCYETLEILPALKKGVIVHFHDIFFPKEYPKKWILEEKNFFWNEQYLLQAFLAFNDSFEILFCGSYMHYKYSGLLVQYLKNYDPQKTLPGSIWIRKTK